MQQNQPLPKLSVGGMFFLAKYSCTISLGRFTNQNRKQGIFVIMCGLKLKVAEVLMKSLAVHNIFLNVWRKILKIYWDLRHKKNKTCYCFQTLVQVKIKAHS